MQVYIFLECEELPLAMGTIKQFLLLQFLDDLLPEGIEVSLTLWELINN